MYLVMCWPWPLNLDLLETLYTGFSWEKFLSGTWNWVMAPKQHFCPNLFMWWPWPWTFGFKFSEMLSTAQSLFDWQVFLPFTLNWSYSSVTAFYHWQNFLSDIYLNGFVTPKLHFRPYLVMWWPWPLTFETQIFRNA